MSDQRSPLTPDLPPEVEVSDQPAPPQESDRKAPGGARPARQRTTDEQTTGERPYGEAERDVTEQTPECEPPD